MILPVHLKLDVILPVHLKLDVILPVHLKLDVILPVHLKLDVILPVHLKLDVILPLHLKLDVILPVHLKLDVIFPVHLKLDVILPVHLKLDVILPVHLKLDVILPVHRKLDVILPVHLYILPVHLNTSKLGVAVSSAIEITGSVRRTEATIVVLISFCGIFYFPWHRHQTEGIDGFYCLFRKTQAMCGERNCPTFETAGVDSTDSPTLYSTTTTTIQLQCITNSVRVCRLVRASVHHVMLRLRNDMHE